MSRYIDADKLKQELDEWAINLHKPTNLVRDDTFVIIDEQPTADVVEVVRCKDCKFNNAKDKNKGVAACGLMVDVHNADDYCSYGERKEQEHDN